MASTRIVVHGSRGRDPQRCPYCRTNVLPLEREWACGECETVHHEGCVREHGGCTVHGCPGRFRPAPRPGRSTMAERWLVVRQREGLLTTEEGDRQCPGCRELIGEAATWTCGRCHTPQHAACARSRGRCTIAACRGELDSREEVGAPSPPRPRRRAPRVRVEIDGEQVRPAQLVVAALALGLIGLAMSVAHAWQPGWFVLALVFSVVGIAGANDRGRGR